MTSVLFLPVTESLSGMVVYFRPTTLGRYNGPTSLSKEIKAIGGLYAAFGYGVLFPNLIGYLEDSNIHPYILYPQQNVRSAITALNKIETDGLFM
jgi:hypothetical protein